MWLGARTTPSTITAKVTLTLTLITLTLTLITLQTLVKTERSAEKLADVSAERRDGSNSYHFCYCWSVITMAAFMLARISAKRSGQTLFCAQAVDQSLTLIQLAA